MGVGVANLDQVLIAAGLRDGGVVELLDNLLADIPSFETNIGQMLT